MPLIYIAHQPHSKRLAFQDQPVTYTALVPYVGRALMAPFGAFIYLYKTLYLDTTRRIPIYLQGYSLYAPTLEAHEQI